MNGDDKKFLTAMSAEVAAYRLSVARMAWCCSIGFEDYVCACQELGLGWDEGLKAVYDTMEQGANPQ